MTLLRITGADLTGTSGTQNRTYTIGSGTLLESSFKGWVAGAFLQTDDYSISGNTITFLGYVDDDQNVTLEYLTEENQSSYTAFGYTTVQSVYDACGLDSTVVAESIIQRFITQAEAEVDAKTFTTYWATQTSGQVSSSGANTLVVTGSPYTSDEYASKYLYIYSGTGSGQARKILSNDANTFTVDRDWTTALDNTSKFVVTHSAQNPYQSQLYDGDGSQLFFLEDYPLVLLEALSISSTSVTPSNVYQYSKIGKLQLGPSSEVKYFYDTPQAVDIAHWWGVYPIPQNVITYVTLAAAEMTLASQMGGTYNVPSTYTLPEGSVTIGQAYVNIDSTARRINQERKSVESTLAKYPVIA